MDEQKVQPSKKRSFDAVSQDDGAGGNNIISALQQDDDARMDATTTGSGTKGGQLRCARSLKRTTRGPGDSSGCSGRFGGTEEVGFWARQCTFTHGVLL